MKILIYGAGVIGCELAHMLCKKNDVTLLARGKWKEAIDANGLVIRHYVQMKTTVDRLNAIDVLEPTDVYDLVFVVMQAVQLPEALPVIAKNASAYIVFVGNNMAPQETARQAADNSPVEKEIAFGFQMTAGRREGGKVISVHAGVGMTVGGLNAPLSQRFQERLKAVFDGTGYRLKWENEMDAWLKCHMAFILPVCYVCYITNGCLPNATGKQRKSVLDAAFEGYSLLQALGIPIRPEGDEASFHGVKRVLMLAMLFIMAKTSLGRLAASDHAMRALDEMRYLDAGFAALRKQTDMPMPIWDMLRQGSMIEERALPR